MTATLDFPRRRFRWLRIATAVVVALLALGVTLRWLARDPFAAEVERIGGRYRQEVIESGFDAFMKALQREPLTVFHWIDLEHSRADDAWLAAHRDSIQRKSHLSLFVGNARVTAEGLAALRGLENMHSLDLTGTAVEEIAVETVVELPNLVALYISHTGIPDAALAGLSRSPHLVFVCIDARQATDAGINGLLTCPKLESLWIRDADDASAARLARFKRLTSLVLQGADVTAAAFPALKELQGLRVLTFFDTDLSEVELAELRQALPGCTVQQLDYEKVEAISESSWK